MRYMPQEEERELRPNADTSSRAPRHLRNTQVRMPNNQLSPLLDSFGIAHANPLMLHGRTPVPKHHHLTPVGSGELIVLFRVPRLHCERFPILSRLDTLPRSSHHTLATAHKEGLMSNTLTVSQRLGMSQADLALIGGLNPGHASEIARGRRPLPLRLVEALEELGWQRDAVQAAWARARETERRRVLAKIRARNNNSSKGGSTNAQP